MTKAVEELFKDAVSKHVAGELDQSTTLYERVLKLEPRHIGALSNLGRIARTNKDNTAALKWYLQAAAQSNAPADIFYNLGNLYTDIGKYKDACVSYQRAIAIKPDFALAFSRLSFAHETADNLPEAAIAAGKATQLAQTDEALHYRAALLFEKTGAHENAEHHYRQVLDLSPDRNDAAARLAQNLFRRGIGDEAVAILLGVLSRQPIDAGAMQNLGFIYRSTGYYGKAMEMFKKAHVIAPEIEILQVEIANCLVNLGRANEARAMFDDMLATPQGRRSAASSYLMASLYDPDASPEIILEKHKQLTRDWTVTPKAKPQPRSRRGLRIGYLTADFFGNHPVAQFIAPVLTTHADPQFGIKSFAYDASPRGDATAQAMTSLCDVRDISALNDEAAAVLIEKDQLDILIDLSGHTSGRRLSVLGYRPAPVQACFIGYPSTTGFSAVDYLIADQHLVPTQHEHHYSEEIICLPGSFLCFQPPPNMPEVDKKGGDTVTFGSLNHLPKLNGGVIDAWSQILIGTPNSKLLLQCGAFAEPATIETVREKFAQRGIERSRLRLLGPQSFEQAMIRYNEIDIALDPFPYNGGTTTCHALWMATPVVTLSGDYFCGRMGASILTAADRTEWIAETKERYIELSITLAADRFSLRAAQQTLKHEVRGSLLCDVEKYSSALANAYRTMAGHTTLE